MTVAFGRSMVTRGGGVPRASFSGGLVMSIDGREWDDLRGDEFRVEVASFPEVEEESKSPRSPVPLLIIGGVLAAVQGSLLIFEMNLYGYVLGVMSSVILATALLRDQRLQAKRDYVYIAWFRKTTVATRILVIILSFIHIILLAIDKSK